MTVAALLVMRHLAPITRQTGQLGTKLECENFQESTRIVKIVAGGGPHFGVQKTDPKIGFPDYLCLFICLSIYLSIYLYVCTRAKRVITLENLR